MVAHQNYTFFLYLNSYFLIHAHMCFGYDMIIDIHSLIFFIIIFFPIFSLPPFSFWQ